MSRFFPFFVAFSVLFSPIIRQPYSHFCFQPFYCFLFLFFSCSHVILRDKAPGQRECDSSIDNINKCIRDIEQASLAAVSQNLPSRDDISLEVSNHQKITWHFPTDNHRFLSLFAFVSVWLSLSGCLSLSLAFFLSFPLSVSQSDFIFFLFLVLVLLFVSLC